MSIITPNIDASPYVGVRNVKGKVRVKTHNDAPWLDNFFNGKENYDQITGITRGNTYDVIRVEGFGDAEDITIINDNGEEQTLGDFFFDEIQQKGNQHETQHRINNENNIPIVCIHTHLADSGTCY